MHFFERLEINFIIYILDTFCIFSICGFITFKITQTKHMLLDITGFSESHKRYVWSSHRSICIILSCCYPVSSDYWKTTFICGNCEDVAS